MPIPRKRPFPIPGVRLISVGNAAKGINLSQPDAWDGAEFLTHYHRLRVAGYPMRLARKMAQAKFGINAEESAVATARAVGQEPLRKAMDAGKVYTTGPVPEEERRLHQKAGEDAQVCLNCHEPFSILALQCPRCGAKV